MPRTTAIVESVIPARTGRSYARREETARLERWLVGLAKNARRTLASRSFQPEGSMKNVLLGLSVVAAIALIACTSDDGTSSSSSSSGGTPSATVNVLPNRFDPQTVTIK